MSKINFPKKQEQRLIPKYLLEYSEELQKNHPDPSADWGGGSTYTAGEGIVIENDEISVDAEDVALIKNLATVAFSGSYNDLSNKPDLSVYELKSEAFSGDYDDLTDKPDLSVYELKSEAFSGNYNDLTNKPTNLVNTNGDQTITGTKTFVGTKRIKLKQSSASDKPGFTIYNTGTSEKGYLEFNPDDNGFFIGRYGAYRANQFGFKTSTTSASHKLLVPNVTLSGNVTDYIPISVNNTKADANGNISINIPTVPTNISAFNNDAGYITGITSSDVTTALGYTPGTSNFSGDYNDLTDKPDLSIYAQSANLATVATSGSYNDLSNKPSIPTAASSTSTVTPTTTQLVFTYTDNTTETITLMTGATVSTTTTLS